LQLAEVSSLYPADRAATVSHYTDSIVGNMLRVIRVAVYSFAKLFNFLKVFCVVRGRWMTENRMVPHTSFYDHVLPKLSGGKKTAGT
jgi:hypothetical protein